MTITQIQKKLDKVQAILTEESTACLHKSSETCVHDNEKVSELITEVQNELDELRLTVGAIHQQMTDLRADLTSISGARK